ncbi:MAG TPA: ABC transporter permease subunit [Anaerolineae bacterium]|nr:ABC transporter permease subunit [Anaerolineae bacterium]
MSEKVTTSPRPVLSAEANGTPAATARTASLFQSARRELGRNGALILMCLPGVIVLFIVAYLPMPGLILAFKNYKFATGIWGSEWVGLKNFQFLFSTGDAFHIIFNTLFLNLLFMTAALVGSLTMAVLLQEIYHRYIAKVYQSILFFPHFISWVIVGYFAFAFLNSDTGWVNNALASVGLPGINWYGEAGYWPAILTIISLWKGLGYFTIIYLAGILAINPEYYEAARIDGANKWQEIWNVTLPMIRPLIIVNVFLAVGRILYANFDFIFNVTRDASLILPTTNVIDTYVYRSLIAVGNYNLASAAGFFQATVGLALIILANWIVRRFEPEQALF